MRIFGSQATLFSLRSGFRIRKLLLELLVAVALAFLVWIYTRSREQSSLDQIEVPVQITLAPGTAANHELEINGSSRIPMSFTGPPSRIRELRTLFYRGLLNVEVKVAVPEEHQKDSTYHGVVQVDAENVPVPPGVVTVIAKGRNRIPYTLHRLVERHLPVQLDYAGDARISKIKVEPATVVVRGPKEVLDHAWVISTQPYTVPDPKSKTIDNDRTINGQASLVKELKGRSIVSSPSSVSFSFRIHPRKKVYHLDKVPVRFLTPPQFSWRSRFASSEAGMVSLKVIGPASDEKPNVLAYLDLSRANLSTGRNVEPLQIQLPRDFELVNDGTRLVAFWLDPIEREISKENSAEIDKLEK